MNTVYTHPKYTIKAGKELNTLLGYKRAMESFATLYNGGSINAFGYSDASTHTLKHEFAAGSQLIRFVATHTTYFKVTPETTKLNNWLEAEGPKSVIECIEYMIK